MIVLPLKVVILFPNASDVQKMACLLESKVETGAVWSHRDSVGELALFADSEMTLGKLLEIVASSSIDAKIQRPEIVCFETVTRSTTVDATHKRFQFGKAEFARVKLDVSPLEIGTGYVFENRSSETSVPEEFVAGVEKGVSSVLEKGLNGLFTVTDIKVSLVDGSYHETDSSPLSFEIAARMACRNAMESAGCVIIEPNMQIEVKCPTRFVSQVINDLHRRRGTIIEVKDNGSITALAPLSNLMGYSIDIAKLTRGEGTAYLKFNHFGPAESGPENHPGNFPPAIGMRA